MYNITGNWVDRCKHVVHQDTTSPLSAICGHIPLSTPQPPLKVNSKRSLVCNIPDTAWMRPAGVYSVQAH